MSLIVLVSGPSGVGKGTLVGRLREALPSLLYSVSWTTRQPRPGEVDGIHYHFVPKCQFLVAVRDGRFLESAPYNDDLYGTPLPPPSQEVLLEIEVKGAQQVMDRAAERGLEVLSVFIMPPGWPDTSVLEARLRQRGEGEANITQRVAIAASEVAVADRFGHVIVNDDLDLAAAELIRLVSDRLAPATAS